MWSFRVSYLLDQRYLYVMANVSWKSFAVGHFIYFENVDEGRDKRHRSQIY